MRRFEATYSGVDDDIWHPDSKWCFGSDNPLVLKIRKMYSLQEEYGWLHDHCTPSDLSQRMHFEFEFPDVETKTLFIMKFS